MVFNDGISVGVASTAALCATSATLLAAFAFKNSLLKKIGVKAEAEAKAPKRWMRVGTVSQLLIYPIKGCAGIHVKQAKVTQLGLSLKGKAYSVSRWPVAVNLLAYNLQRVHRWGIPS